MMSAYQCTAEEAQQRTFQRLFEGKCDNLGEATYQKFMKPTIY